MASALGRRNWLLRRAALASVIIAGRNRAQLIINLGVVGCQSGERSFWEIGEDLLMRIFTASVAVADCAVTLQKKEPRAP